MTEKEQKLREELEACERAARAYADSETLAHRMSRHKFPGMWGTRDRCAAVIAEIKRELEALKEEENPKPVPCRHCGGPGGLWRYGIHSGHAYVYCSTDSCGCRGPRGDDAEAIRKWNAQNAK